MSGKKLLILNSANMFTDGTYNKRTISKNQFIKLIKEAEVIKSSVGYESVCKIIKQLTDVDVSVNRELTKMEDDYAIVGLTLPFRLTSKSKGRRNDPTPDDYIYFIASHAKIS